MDYKEMLQKYMGEVIAHESTDFFPVCPGRSGLNNVYWSQEEIDELNKLAEVYIVKEQENGFNHSDTGRR